MLTLLCSFVAGGLIGYLLGYLNARDEEMLREFKLVSREELEEAEL